jgi:Uma2 family endonuclease
MQVNLSQLIIPSGQYMVLQDVNWESFEKILTELGDERNSPKISYHKGYLQLMTPLAIHEFDKRIIGVFVEILLESLDIEFSALGSTTLKSEKVHKGVEPDECFYIQNEMKVRGKECIDLNQDPPPDLAIDITSHTELEIYEKLNVPELWRFDGKNLEILILQNAHYQNSEISLQFPQFVVKQLIPDYLQKAKTEGCNKAVKAFRQLVIQQLNS